MIVAVMIRAVVVVTVAVREARLACDGIVEMIVVVVLVTVDVVGVAV